MRPGRITFNIKKLKYQNLYIVFNLEGLVLDLSLPLCMCDKPYSEFYEALLDILTIMMSEY